MKLKWALRSLPQGAIFLLGRCGSKKAEGVAIFATFGFPGIAQTP
jgi:hypothetical protein